MNITKLTVAAGQDDLTGDDYRDMYTELRQAASLDRLVALLDSQYSKAYWHKYERGAAQLTRTMRSELRRACGLPALPPTVEEATALASPDAAVWRVGDGVPDHVILVGGAPVTLHVNAGVAAVPVASNVTEVTGGSTPRKRYTRPCVSEAQNRRFLALPTGSTWRDVIEAGLAALEDC